MINFNAEIVNRVHNINGTHELTREEIIEKASRLNGTYRAQFIGQARRAIAEHRAAMTLNATGKIEEAILRETEARIHRISAYVILEEHAN